MDIEKIIRTISPAWALRRAQNNKKIEISEAWQGSSKRRIEFDGFNPSTNDLNYDIFNELGTIRERCCDLERNNCIAAGIVNTKVTSIIGSGLKIKPVIDDSKVNISEYSQRIEDEFELWAGDKFECDGFSQSNFYEIEECVLRSILVKGDIFYKFSYFKNPGCRYSFKVYIIEPERVSNPNNQMDNDYLHSGIKYDKKTGSAIGFYYSTGTNVKTWKFQPFISRSGRVLARHVMFRKTSSQSRGISDLATIITMLKQLGDFTEAYLHKAVVSAILSVFVKTEDGMGMQGLSSSSESSPVTSRYKLGSGTVIQGTTDESVEVIESKTPSDTFDPFVLSILRQIGMAVELPFELLIKHFTSSYTAAQGAFLEAWRMFRRRREFLAKELCAPVYAGWFESCIIDGHLPFEEFLYADKLTKSYYLGHECSGDPQGHIDPLKANKADEIAEDREWTTASYNARMRGQDWSKVVIRKSQEQKFKNEKGIVDEKIT